MVIRNRFSFLIIVILMAYGCQFRGSENKEEIFTTPFHETLQSSKAVPTITATPIPTPIFLFDKPSEAIQAFPTPTEIQLTLSITFPQTTQPYQPNYHELTENIEDIIAESGGRWHIVIKEVGGPSFYEHLPEQRINIASVVKVPLSLLFFATLEEKGISENQLMEHIQSTGTGGRTFEQLLHAMLVKSEEDATKVLAEYISDNLNVPAQLREWGLQNIDLEARRFTANGVASLFERFYQGEFVSSKGQNLILGYLSEYTPNDDARIGSIRKLIPDSYQIYNKRGSLLTPYVVADSAIIENRDGSDYIITIFAYNSEPKTTYEILDQAIGEIALVIWDYLSSFN